MLGLAYAKNLGAIKLGMQFNYHLFSTAGEARQSLMSMEIGAVLKLSECVNVALHLIHPASLKKGPTINGKIAYSYETILGYEVSPAVFLALQLNKEEDKPLNVITNLKYAFADQFFASLSLSTATQQPAAGAGWRWRNFRIELFISYHFQLGSSPGLFLLYQPGKIDPT